jgi:hypothetical protein
MTSWPKDYFQCLREFKFVFEKALSGLSGAPQNLKALVRESGAQGGLFDEKNRRSKIS